MPVLCGVIQNKATYQNYNGLKTTLPELLRANYDYVNFRSADLLYELNSVGISQRKMRLFYISNNVRSS